MIADELMKGCPEDLQESHDRIALRIRRGDPLDVILDSEDFAQFPMTYDWLKTMFAEMEKFQREAFDREQQEFIDFLDSHPEYKG